MKRRKKIFYFVAGIFAILYTGLILTGPQKHTFSLPGADISFIENLKGFSENGINDSIDPKAVLKKYDETRKKAISKSEHFIRQRNNLNIVYHSLCIIAIIASFLVSLLGASKGLLINEKEVEKSIETLKETEMKFKKRIIILSAIAILATTLSNRTSSFSDKAQNTAYEIIDMVKTTDTKMPSAINVHEANNITNSFELDVSKY